MKAYTGYYDRSYKPKKTDLICQFYVEPGCGLSMKKAAERVAAESSVGTWTDLTTDKKRIAKLKAQVFEIKGNWVKIAYPIDLFEEGNMPQILSSIAGNIFGMKDVRNLRLYDIHWPEKLMKSFRGPLYGIPGVRAILNTPERPLCGTIVKPKLGLNEKEHSKVAYDAWSGGIDIVKDDENLSSQSFNNFNKRITQTLKMRDKAEKETGEEKVYMPNITADVETMIKRAEHVRDEGGEYVMVDILTVGWSGLQRIREVTQDLKLAIHAHRAMHGALTRNRKHGISMIAIADIARIIGVDQIHIGTGVGKMSEKKEEVKNTADEISKGFLMEKDHIMSEQWRYVKPVFPVCSGGLYPGVVDKLVKLLGNDIIIQAGGGIHGHPKGTKAGAKAMRQAIEAVMAQCSLKEWAENHKELKEALRKWR